MLFIMGTTNRMPPSEGGTIMQTLRQDAQAIIDKALADEIYLEPLTVETIRRIIGFSGL